MAVAMLALKRYDQTIENVGNCDKNLALKEFFVLTDCYKGISR